MTIVARSAWRLTPWGMKCAEVEARMYETRQDIRFDIGPDEINRHDYAPRITFAHQDEALTAPLTTRRTDKALTFDGLARIEVNIYAKASPLITSDAASNGVDMSPVDLFDMVSAFFEAVRDMLPGRDADPVRMRLYGGEAGVAGSRATITLTIRTQYTKKPGEPATIESVAVSIAPDGEPSAIGT